MRIVDPQSATLTNIEVLAYLTSNPPRRPPNPPPRVGGHWVPSPDLRDHNTVVKEIHNYVARLSPHLLKYPSFTETYGSEGQGAATTTTTTTTRPPPSSATSPQGLTPLDNALRELILRLKPFGLTKGEVLMIVNLGVGLDHLLPGEREQEQEQAEETGAEDREGGEDEGEGDRMDVDVGETDPIQDAVNGGEPDLQMGHDQDDEQEEGEEEVGGIADGDAEAEIAEEDYGAVALLDTVIEEREERLSNSQVAQILTIIREVMGGRRGKRRPSGAQEGDGE